MVARAERAWARKEGFMQAPYIEEYTDHLIGAPKRRHWPMMLLVPVMGAAMIAGGAFVMMIISLIYTP